MKRILTITALVFTLSVVAAAQDTLLDRAKTFRNSDKFEVSYDRFKNQTRVIVEGLILRPKPRLDMRFYASFQGARPYHARIMVLTFTTAEAVSRFRYHPELEVVADGKRFRFERGTWRSKQMPRPTETLTFSITLEEANELANAELTEIRVGMIEAVLSSEHKEALRDFLSLVKPPSIESNPNLSRFFWPRPVSFQLIVRH